MIVNRYVGRISIPYSTCLAAILIALLAVPAAHSYATADRVPGELRSVAGADGEAAADTLVRYALSWSRSSIVDTLVVSSRDTYSCYFYADVGTTTRSFGRFAGEVMILDSRVQLLSVHDILGGDPYTEVSDGLPGLRFVDIDYGGGCLPIGPAEALFELRFLIDPGATGTGDLIYIPFFRDDGLPLLVLSTHDCQTGFFWHPEVETCYVTIGTVSSESTSWGSVRSLYR